MAPADAIRIPKRPSDIDVSAFRAITGCTDVTSVRASDEDHGTALRGRLHLSGGPEVPATAFVKLAPVRAAARLLNRVMQLACNEAAVYHRLGPELQGVAPRILGTAADRRSGRAVVIMEDLASRGATFGDVTAGCSIDEALAVATVLGRVHRRFLGSPRFGSGDLSFLVAPPSTSIGTMTWQMVRMIPKDFHDVVSDGFRQRATMLSTRRRDISALIRARSDTLIHGDTHLGNMCFVDGAPIVFDWQVASMGPGLKDLAYFASTSLTTEDRRTADEDIVRAYVDAINTGDGDVLTFDEAWHGYRLFAFTGFIATAVTARFGVRLQGFETTRAGLSRTVAAVIDLASLDLLQACLK